jgi:glycosyltransferase involved in cell wall biosynthesis
MVRPDLGGRLLTYVPGQFAGFDAQAFQEAPDAWIDAYLEANIRALALVFDRWTPQLVQANHAVMQPCAVRRALRGRAPYVVTIHGSEINFTIRKDPRMVPFAREGLEGAAAIGALSRTSRDEVITFFREAGLDLADKTVELPPGVDTGLFAPGSEGRQELKRVSPQIDADADDIAVFAGRLLWTKGLQYVIAAMPLVLRRRPRLQLVAVGEGPMHRPLVDMIEALDAGNLETAREMTEKRPELAASRDYGPVIPDLSADGQRAYIESATGRLKARVHFTGHLKHAQLAPLFAAADLSLAPSVFPEAFGLVSIEAMSAGAVPVSTYQTGLRSPLDVLAGELDDSLLRSLAPGAALTPLLARLIVHVLETFPTREPYFRERLHTLAARHFSWEIVARSYLEFARS